MFFKHFIWSWNHYVVYIFVFLICGLLVWPRLRQALAPALELAFDVGAYFPPVLTSLSRRAVGDVIHGREPCGDSRRLERQFAERLRSVILYTYDRRVGRVAVVGHSLGSIIAKTARK
jgi:hypothetical protein